MGRIRTIKPDFWRNEELSTVPEPTRLLAIALLNYADDEGYFNANPKLVQSECFPLTEPSVNVHVMLTQLSNIGYIRLGIAEDGKHYGQVLKFTQHQRVSHPYPSKIKDLEIDWEHSRNIHGTFTEHSPMEIEKEIEIEKEGKSKTTSVLNDKIVFDSRSGKFENIPDILIAKWKEAYPAVDIWAEIHKAESWLLSNPKNKKSNYPRFLTGWLSRAQDRAPRCGPPGAVSADRDARREASEQAGRERHEKWLAEKEGKNAGQSSPGGEAARNNAGVQGQGQDGVVRGLSAGDGGEDKAEGMQHKDTAVVR